MKLLHKSRYSNSPKSGELIAEAMEAIKGADTIIFEDYASVCIDGTEAENLFYQVVELFDPSEEIHLVIDRFLDTDVNITLVRPDRNDALKARLSELEGRVTLALNEYNKSNAKGVLANLEAALNIN
jgi:hypothetical protein